MSTIKVNALRHTGGSSDNITLDSSGRVLIGTTTEGHANADDLTIAGSGSAGITIRTGTTSTGGIFFSDATTGDGEYDGYIEYNQNTREYNFGSAATDAMRIDASQNLKFNSGFGSVGTAYGVRAWVCFNGNNGSLIDGGNVSSVTDNAMGNYTINFSNSMPDTNYAAAGSTDSSTGGDGTVFGPPATGSIVMKVFDSGGTLRDHDKVFAIIVR